jgi:hypothetical protein
VSLKNKVLVFIISIHLVPNAFACSMSEKVCVKEGIRFIALDIPVEPMSSRNLKFVEEKDWFGWRKLDYKGPLNTSISFMRLRHDESIFSASIWQKSGDKIKNKSLDVNLFLRAIPKYLYFSRWDYSGPCRTLGGEFLEIGSINEVSTGDFRLDDSFKIIDAALTDYWEGKISANAAKSLISETKFSNFESVVDQMSQYKTSNPEIILDRFTLSGKIEPDGILSKVISLFNDKSAEFSFSGKIVLKKHNACVEFRDRE